MPFVQLPSGSRFFIDEKDVDLEYEKSCSIIGAYLHGGAVCEVEDTDVEIYSAIVRCAEDESGEIVSNHETIMKIEKAIMGLNKNKNPEWFPLDKYRE